MFLFFLIISCFIEVVERVGEMTDMVGGSINLETVTGSTLLGGICLYFLFFILVLVFSR